MSEPRFPNPSMTANMLRDTLPELSDCTNAAELVAGWADLRDHTLQQMENLSRSLPQAMRSGQYDDVASGLNYLHEVSVLQSRAETFLRYYEATHHQDMWNDDTSKQFKSDIEQGVRSLDATRKSACLSVIESVKEVGDTELLAAHPELMQIGYLLAEQNNNWQMRPPRGESLPDDPPELKAYNAAIKQAKETYDEFTNEKVSFSDFKEKASKALGDKFLAEDRLAREIDPQSSALSRAGDSMGVSEDVFRSILEALPEGLEAAKFPSIRMPVSFSWQEAQVLVRDAYRDFHPSMGEIAERAFSEGWIDARPAGNQKSGAAFSDEGVQQRFWKDGHPYIIMQYGSGLGSGSVGNVMTLAHEMGHAIAQYLESASPEERARLGVEDIDGQMPSQLRNGAVHETFAHTGEKIVAEHMMQQFDGIKGKAIARDLEVHNMERVRLNMYLTPELELRDLAIQNGEITGDDLVSAYARAAKDAEYTLPGKMLTQREVVLNHVKGSFQLFQSSPMYNAHYVLAETGSRAIMQAMREAGPEERVLLQENLLNMMGRGSGNNAGWQQMMAHVGIDVTEQDFASHAMTFRARPEDKHRAEPVQLAETEISVETARNVPPLRQATEPMQFEQRLSAVTAQLESKMGRPQQSSPQGASQPTPGDLKAPSVQLEQQPGSRQR